MSRSTLTRLQKIDTTRVGEQVRPRLKPRGLPPALAEHPVYHTRDPAEATRLAADVFGRCRLQVAAGRLDAFEANFHAALLRDITLGHLDYSTEAVLEAPSVPDSFLVVVPASGHSTVCVDGTTVEATPVTAVVVNPCSEVTATSYDQTAHVIVRVPRTALESHLVRLLGRSLEQPLRFVPEFLLADAGASRWNFAVQILHSELLDAESLLHLGVGLGPLEEFLMSALLYSHASNYTAHLTPLHDHADKRIVRSACNFIEANLSRPLTVPEVARHLGVSVRALQMGFRADLATTPMTYLRDRRLDRAHADLADASIRHPPTVSEVASRWGFGHLGRFSTEYRARFGESPSQTLRR